MKLQDAPQLIDLVVLVRVIERGSIARAAADLGVPPSTLSRRITGLERRLGVRVLERTTRSLRATEVGELLAQRGARIRHELDDADRAVADHQNAPRGLLRLSVPTPVASDFLGPALAEYVQRYPEMRVDIVAEDRLVDLVTEGFDAVIRIGRLRDSTLGAVRLGMVRPVLCAARRYLDRAAPLRRPAELSAHATIGFGERRRDTWTFVGARGALEEVTLAPRMVATSAPLVAQLAAAGAGIALIPSFVATSANLVVLEPGGFKPQGYDLSIVTPSRRPGGAKVRAFIDLMRSFAVARPDIFDV